MFRQHSTRWVTRVIFAALLLVSGCSSKPERQLDTGAKGIISADLSETHAAVASLNGQASIWSLVNQEQQRILEFQSGKTLDIQYMVFNHVGNYLFTSESKQLALWDANSGQLLRTLYSEKSVLCLTLDTTGSIGVIGKIDGNVDVINLATNKLLKQFRHPYPINDVALSHNGKWLLTAGHDHRAILWDISTTQRIATFDHDQSIEHIGFSPDDREIITTGMLTPIRFWDRLSHELISMIPGRVTVSAFAFSSDESLIAVGVLPDKLQAWQRQGTKWHKVAQWRLPTAPSWQPSRTSIRSIRWEPNRRHIITIDSYGRISWWKVPPAVV